MPEKLDQHISFVCPECEAQLKVPSKLAGVSGPCPKCHATITAPAIGPAPRNTGSQVQASTPEKEMADDDAAAAVEETAVESSAEEKPDSTPDPVPGAPSLGEEPASRDLTEDSPVPHDGGDAADEDGLPLQSIETGGLEPRQSEKGEDTVNTDKPAGREASESGQRSTFNILPPPNHNAQAPPSFPPFPGDSQSNHPAPPLPPLDHTVLPESEPGDASPPIDNTAITAAPREQPDPVAPPCDKTEPILPYPKSVESSPPIESRPPITPSFNLEDPLAANSSQDENHADEQLAGEGSPQLAGEAPPQVPTPGDPDLSHDHGSELDHECGREPEPKPSEVSPAAPSPSQPFFLPGQPPPSPEGSTPGPAVSPASSDLDNPPGIQNKATAADENPIPDTSAPQPQLIPRTLATASSSAESSPPSKSISPATDNKVDRPSDFNTGPADESEPAAPAANDCPTPNPIIASISNQLDSMRSKSAYLREQMENSGFASLFKILIIFAIIVFGGIALLVADFYAGGIPILHKLPGIDPMSSLVSSILTPPNMGADPENPGQGNNSSTTTILDSKTDTIAQADISSSFENNNIIADTVENPLVATSPPSPASPMISPPPTLPPGSPPETDSKPGSIGPRVGTPALGENSVEASPMPKTDLQSAPASPVATPAAPRELPPPPTIGMAPSNTALPIDPLTSPLDPSPLPTPPLAIDGSQSDASKMASFPPDPSIPAPSAKVGSTGDDAPSPAPAMIRAVPVEIPGAVPVDENSQASPAIADSPPGKKEAGKILSEPRQVVDAFLRASTWKERLPYIYNGEALKEIIDEYYKQDPQGAITDYTLEFINMERSHSDNTLFYVFLLTTKRLPEGFPIILRTEKDTLKVDWEIFAEFNDQHFDYFIKSEDRGPHPLRLMLKRTSYWGPDKEKFSDLDDYVCFGVSSAPFLSKGEFAFVKKGTPLAKQLEANLPWGQRPLSAIVELQKVEFAHGEDHLLIKGIVTDGWFSPAVKP